jgi:hypothetical protein
MRKCMCLLGEVTRRIRKREIWKIIRMPCEIGMEVDSINYPLL